MPPLIDLPQAAHTSFDLSMLFGAEAVEVFSAAYAMTRGEQLREVLLWDLAASVRAFPDPALWLPGWLDAGRSDLTPAIVQSRLCDFVGRALSAS